MSIEVRSVFNWMYSFKDSKETMKQTKLSLFFRLMFRLFRGLPSAIMPSLPVRLLPPRKARRITRRENGTQLVELCISLPILLILMAGATEFGRFFYTYATLTSAVRAGARHACKWQKSASWTIPETRRFVVYGDVSDTSKGPIIPDLQESQVDIQANGPAPNRIESVTVKIINYQYRPLFDLGKITGIQGLTLNISISPSSTMKQLFNGPVNGNQGS